MSQKYATIARNVLAADPVVLSWASGGVLDRDPRRSGASATATFTVDGTGDIRPLVACVPGNATRSIGGPDNAVEHSVLIRLFAPNHAAYRQSMDTTVARIIAKLFRYRAGNTAPGHFRWSSRLGITGGGAFEDVIYDEIRFAVVATHEGVTV